MLGWRGLQQKKTTHSKSRFLAITRYFVLFDHGENHGNRSEGIGRPRRLPLQDSSRSFPTLKSHLLHNFIVIMAKFATVEALNTHLATRSYVTGYSLSEDDKAALANLKAFPSSSAQPHAYRWALHISALTGNRYAVECLNCRVEGI